MVFVLPDEGYGVEDLLASPQALEAALTGGESKFGEVVWKLPKFSIEAKYDCKQMLKNLGINAAFSQTADFSAMSNSIVCIDGIVQETHISVNEDGVEAAAFTDIGYAGAAMPTDQAEMILDRPFLYAVQDKNGVILFLGVYQGATGER